MNKDFIFGMNMHNKNYQSYSHDDYERNLDYCKEMGINLIRFNFVPITNDDYEYLNDVIDMGMAHGMRFMLVIDMDIFSDEKDENFYYNYYKMLAKTEKGRIEYYQIFNELDVCAMHTSAGEIFNAGDGKVKEEYDPSRFCKIVPSIKGAIRGIRESDLNAKICINFSWWHTYMIELLDEQGCEWDITGCDWYADCENSSSFKDLQNWLENRFPNRPIIICETNWWMYNKPYELNKQWDCQADWVKKFTTNVFNNRASSLKGIIYYELMDQPCLEVSAGKYDAEAHFGFISCGTAGKKNGKKPVFSALKETIRKLIIPD